MVKRIIIRRDDVDTVKLYGPLKEAGLYLLELAEKYPDGSLDEHWTGYEDMEMTILFTSEETDDEERHRIAAEKYAKEREEREKNLKKSREKDLKEYNRLKNKLGMY